MCELAPLNATRELIINRTVPPFDNPDLRRAMAMTFDRKAFIDILTEGQGSIGGAMMPPPEGLWGMPPDLLKTLPGYDPDVQQNRAEARKIRQKIGNGPDNRLKIKLSTRNVPPDRDSPLSTRGGSRMRESRTYGSVRGAPSNGRPYRDLPWVLP